MAKNAKKTSSKLDCATATDIELEPFIRQGQHFFSVNSFCLHVPSLVQWGISNRASNDYAVINRKVMLCALKLDSFASEASYVCKQTADQSKQIVDSSK